MKTYKSSIRERSREKKTMFPEMDKRERSAPAAFRILSAAVAVMVLTFAGMTADAAVRQKGFASAEEAVNAVITAARNNEDRELLAIFGSPAKGLFFSGDAVADRQRREKFLRAYDEKNGLVPEDGGMVMVIGKDDWPFPIPLVKKGETWFFDTKKGRSEILNRRIGQNELSTIQIMLAIVDAQREYAMADHDGNGLLEYAGKFWSDPGKKNGLYWETKEGEPPSPVGELIVKARAGGYTQKGPLQKPLPYYGYYYRMLQKQGRHAAGGAFDYIVKGKQIGGFGVIAYPAKYGNSGVMTFMVNHDGVVYQKDLGRNSATSAKALKRFDPDGTWKKVE